MCWVLDILLGTGSQVSSQFLGGHRRTMLSVCLVRYGIAVLDLCVGVVVLSVEPAVASSPGPFSALGLSLRSCLLPS